MCYNQTGDISTQDGTPLKLVDKFTYLGSSVASTEKDIDTRLTKAWTAINRLSIIWKSDLTDKMKRSFFQAAVTSILLYGCTTWTLTKRLEKKLDGNYTRMLRAILNKSWRQHPTRHQLYGHLPPITKTIQVRRTRHAGHCWRSKDELIRDVLLWTPTHGRAKAGRPARTYIQQLCEDTGCCPEDLPRAMSDREEWRERVRDIRATSTTWWWWWWWHSLCTSLAFSVSLSLSLAHTHIHIHTHMYIISGVYIHFVPLSLCLSLPLAHSQIHTHKYTPHTYTHTNHLEESKWFSEKLIHNITNSDYPTNSWRGSCKKSRGDTLTCRFRQGIWFHAQMEYGTNTSSLWYSQRNHSSQNDAR